MASPDTGGPAARTSLLPVLGLFFGIAVSIGGTLGVGILRQPGPVASYLRAPWLIMLMWFAGAVYSACGASNVSELATMIPRAGGFYVYAHEAMGDYAGFAVGWSDFLANVAPAAYGAMAAVEFVQRLVPAVGPYAAVVAAGAILAFAAMQWFGVRLSGPGQHGVCATSNTSSSPLARDRGRHSRGLNPAGASYAGYANVLSQPGGSKGPSLRWPYSPSGNDAQEETLSMPDQDRFERQDQDDSAGVSGRTG